MKAIHYKGQNKFDLFDKPEESTKKVSLAFYHQELKANLSAGKEIINPEVLRIYDFKGSWYMITEKDVYKTSPNTDRELKPGEIFDLPDNIWFEEGWTPEDREEEQWIKVVRLFVKEEVNPVETQDELIDDLFGDLSDLSHFWGNAECMKKLRNHLKSKFTITRNEKL